MRALEFSIAWRYLRSRRGSRLLSLISVIAIGGVLVGVSALIVIMGVMNGLQRDLRDKILVGSPDLRVIPYGSAMRMSDWKSVRDEILKVKGVVAAAPVVTTQGLVRNSAGFVTGAQVVGIEPTGTPGADVTTIRSHAILGDFRFKRDGISLPGAVLGKSLATKLSAFPGDTIVMLGAGSADMNAATGALIPHADSVVVSGIFETGMYEYDDLYLYVNLPVAQRFAALGEDVTDIEVRTTDRWRAAQVADTIRATLKSPVRAMDWQEQNRQLFQALKLEKLGMSVILLLIVIVAAFNIVSTLTMVVSDKTREIGILRAMGMPARSIRRIFPVTRRGGWCRWHRWGTDTRHGRGGGDRALSPDRARSECVLHRPLAGRDADQRCRPDRVLESRDLRGGDAVSGVAGREAVSRRGYSS